MKRVLPATVWVLICVGSVLGDFSIVEEIYLNENFSGRAVVKYRIETQDLKFWRTKTPLEQLVAPMPVTEALAKQLCQRGHARLESFKEKSGVEGPPRSGDAGEKADYVQVTIEYSFDRAEDMRVFFPGKVRFSGYSTEQIRRDLTEKELKSISDLVQVLPPEQKFYFFMVSEPLDERKSELLPPGANPRAVEGWQYMVRTIVHLPKRVLMTNGHPLDKNAGIIQWDYPLMGMYSNRMIYLALVTDAPRYEIYFAIVFSVVGAVLVFYTLVWYRRRRRAGMM